MGSNYGKRYTDSFKRQIVDAVAALMAEDVSLNMACKRIADANDLSRQSIRTWVKKFYTVSEAKTEATFSLTEMVQEWEGLQSKIANMEHELDTLRQTAKELREQILSTFE